MDSNSVENLLLQDVLANFELMQIIVLAGALAIAIIGAILTARAAAMLSEAKLVYSRIAQVEKNVAVVTGAANSVRGSQCGQCISVRRKKIAPKRDRLVV